MICARRTSPAPSFCERVIRPSLCPSSSLNARTRRVMATSPAQTGTSCNAPASEKSHLISRIMNGTLGGMLAGAPFLPGHTVLLNATDPRNPREVVTDRLKSYPGALREMKQKRELWRFARHRRGRCLNNRVEQDHRRIKRLTRPMLGFQGFWTAKRTLAGIEAMAMLAKGQVRAVPRGDMPAQRAFVQQIFGLAA